MLLVLAIDHAVAAPMFEVTVEGVGSISVEAPVGPVSEAVGVLDLGRRQQLQVLIRPGQGQPGEDYIVETTLRQRRRETGLTHTYVFCAQRCEMSVRPDPPTRDRVRPGGRVNESAV